MFDFTAMSSILESGNSTGFLFHSSIFCCRVALPESLSSVSVVEPDFKTSLRGASSILAMAGLLLVPFQIPVIRAILIQNAATEQATLDGGRLPRLRVGQVRRRGPVEASAVVLRHGRSLRRLVPKSGVM